MEEGRHCKNGTTHFKVLDASRRKKLHLECNFKVSGLQKSQWSLLHRQDSKSFYEVLSK